jgi:hypothetical protein
LRLAIPRRIFLAGCALSIVSATRALMLKGPSGNPYSEPIATFDVPYIQSIAIDDRTNHLYLHWSDPTTKELAYISRYRINGTSGFEYLDQMTPSHLIGHQGLTVYHAPDGLWLFAPSGSDPASVVRFQYKANSGPADIRSYVVLDSGDRRDGAVTTSISYDQRWLIVSRRTGSAGNLTNMIRVFDLSSLATSDTEDWSDKATYEWHHAYLPDTPVQGIACFQDNVYIAMGGTKNTAQKLMLQHRIDGEPVHQPTPIETARYWADSYAKEVYEPEGLCFAAILGNREPSLYIGFNLGRNGRIKAIFSYD